MNPVVIPNSGWNAILTELTTALMLWAGAKIHLFKNNFVPVPGMDLAALTEADFTGYAASAAVTWNAAGYLPDGTACVVSDLKNFVVGATPAILNTIYGYYLTDGAGAILHFARRFDNPVVLNQAGNFVDVVASYPAYGSNV